MADNKYIIPDYRLDRMAGTEVALLKNDDTDASSPLNYELHNAYFKYTHFVLAFMACIGMSVSRIWDFLEKGKFLLVTTST